MLKIQILKILFMLKIFFMLKIIMLICSVLQFFYAACSFPYWVR